jgi:hypothetical protein
MNWKIQLEEYEKSKDWKSAIKLMQKIVPDNSKNVEIYVRVIYLLHSFLLEGDYSESEQDFIASSLKHCFDESYRRFSENAEYLFFIGKILYVAEWYFGIDDDFKPVEEKHAFQMQKKAFEKEPENGLFEWAYRFSLNDGSSGGLAKQVLQDKTIIDWLKAKGFAGESILESLERNKLM